MTARMVARVVEPPSALRPTMSSPRRYLLRMTLFLAAVAVVAIVLAPGLTSAFMANPALNGVILFTLAFGIFFTFRAVLNLQPDVAWIQGYFAQRLHSSQATLPEPRLVAPIARVLAEQQGSLSLSALAMRALLDGIAARLAEGRDIARYLTGLLIFLGLLGTFWGLIETVNSAGTVISGLALEGADLGSVFTNLKEGLEGPLTGMGTAFGASLLGLAGSLTLGFLELQAGQAQNRFYNELEDWLSANTKLTGGPGGGEAIGYDVGESPLPAYIESVVAQTADNLEAMRRLAEQAEDQRRQSTGVLVALVERLTTLNDHLLAQQAATLRLVEDQAELRPVLARLAEAVASDRLGLDEATRQHIRSLDAALRRMIEEAATGRLQIASEIRGEIKLLARTIAALAEDPGTR